MSPSVVVHRCLLAACSSGSKDARRCRRHGDVFGNALVELFPVDHIRDVHGAVLRRADAAPVIRPLEMKMQQAGCQLLTAGHLRSPLRDGHRTARPASSVCRGRPRSAWARCSVEGLSGMSLAGPTPPMNNYSGADAAAVTPLRRGRGRHGAVGQVHRGYQVHQGAGADQPGAHPRQPGKPMHLTWTPPGQAGISRIQIALEIAAPRRIQGTDRLRCRPTPARSTFRRRW